MAPSPQTNPFPGLRPFEPDEDHLFFGREEEVDDLLRLLRSQRLLSVVGTSGCGKSSLVRSGLIPSLHSGMMMQAGSSWRVALFRPGEDPIGHLAAALDQPGVLAWQEPAELENTHRVMIEATLRRGTLGLVEAIEQAHLPPSDNVLVLVDQFEEIFRFRRIRQQDAAREDAVSFVKMLLEASAQRNLPIYVVITMRSDFIGECMELPGLPQALNRSQYLVPRMTRDELRSAITGPIAVAGADITPRLVRRLLNDIGDEPDDLPLLQHSLMRTWEHWCEHNKPDQPIDLDNYEAVGTLRKALSLHAEEAYHETRGGEVPWLTQRVFKALTDTFSDPRGVRRPTSIGEIALASKVSEAQVIRIVEIFRRPGRSFLMPSASVPLSGTTVVDLSHESLMRCWTRLIRWADEERLSAEFYVRLSREAAWHEAQKAGLWDDPELELGLRWRETNHPTATWSRRYDRGFERAMAFLDLSERERARQRAERRAMRIRRLVFAWGTAAVLLVMAGVLAVLWVRASTAQDRAEQSLSEAMQAVEQFLASTDRQINQVGADSPEMQEFRRTLLEKAKPFYARLAALSPDNTTLLQSAAMARLRLGQINRLLHDPLNAIEEYKHARTEFQKLSTLEPGNPIHRQYLATVSNWLGETYRSMPDRHAEADEEYDKAIALQTALVTEVPSTVAYQQELARSLYNRAILHNATASPGEPDFVKAETDLRESIKLLEPIVERQGEADATQDLARAYNDLASHTADDRDRFLDDPVRNMREIQSRTEAAVALTGKAMALHARLIDANPANREYKLELAKFRNNVAIWLLDLGKRDEAEAMNRGAITLLDDLNRPTPTVGIEHADAYTLKGLIQARRRPADALGPFREALEGYKGLGSSHDLSGNADFHRRFAELVSYMAQLTPASAMAGAIADAATFYAPIADKALEAGQTAQVGNVLASFSEYKAPLPASTRQTLDRLLSAHQQKTRGTAAR